MPGRRRDEQLVNQLIRPDLATWFSSGFLDLFNWSATGLLFRCQREHPLPISRDKCSRAGVVCALITITPTCASFVAKHSLQTSFNQRLSDFYRRRDREDSRGMRPRLSISHFPLVLSRSRSPDRRRRSFFFWMNAGLVASFTEVKPERLFHSEKTCNALVRAFIPRRENRDKRRQAAHDAITDTRGRGFCNQLDHNRSAYRSSLYRSVSFVGGARLRNPYRYGEGGKK